MKVENPDTFAGVTMALFENSVQCTKITPTDFGTSTKYRHISSYVRPTQLIKPAVGEFASSFDRCIGKDPGQCILTVWVCFLAVG